MEYKIPTAQELLKKYGLNSPTMINADTAEALMIEFAKLHVDAALKDATEKAEIDYESHWSGEQEGSSYLNRYSILNAYPLSNIK